MIGCDLGEKGRLGREIFSGADARKEPLDSRRVLGRHSTGMTQRDHIRLLQGTLDMLVLQTLIFGPRHGHGIATTIEHTTDRVLLVDHGSLYPALQRLERAGLIASEWGTSEHKRRARFYRLTAAGRKKLTAETGKWQKLVSAVGRILKPLPEDLR
jgi:PadR family transcriptional regulator